MSGQQETALFEIDGLRTSFKTEAGVVRAVRGASLRIGKGESIGIVGESGSGKTVSMLSALRLVPPSATIEAKALRFDGADLLAASPKQIRQLNGKDIGFILQDPMTSLYPLMKVGDQIGETLRLHLGLSRAAARLRTIEILKLVGIPDPEVRLRQLPFEFSGGMRQRVMIAMAIACNPKLVIADEPTTALDVTIQAQILDLLKDLKSKLQTSIVLISHDLGVIAGMCTKVFVMYGGRVVEAGTVDELFYEPAHPYTLGLLRSIPEADPACKRKLIPIPGSPIDMLAPPPGCAFAPRCPDAMRICKSTQPEVSMLSGTHRAECWLLDARAPKRASEAQQC